MRLSAFDSADTEEVVALFARVFGDAEGAEEGRSIAGLVSDLIGTTQAGDLIGFVAYKDEKIVASIFFSRLLLSINKSAFILSPVAVATEVQGEGLGQQLINYGIEHLKALNVELLFTYGDPAFYNKVGFSPISESLVKAPCTLSQPEGWLAQSLNDSSLERLENSSQSITCQCVSALAAQKYW